MTNEKQTLELKGWPAVLVLAGIVTFSVWRLFSAHADLENGASDRLRDWITTEYHRDALTHYRDTPELLAEKVKQIEQLSFRNISARGKPDNMIVRVEVAPNPAEPAGTEHKRYFRMQYDELTGWHLRREVGVINWWLALWP